MARCRSVYQNRDTQGNPLGSPKRCTRPEGHPIGKVQDGQDYVEMHSNGGIGSRYRWPDEAAEELPALSRPDETGYPDDSQSIGDHHG